MVQSGKENLKVPLPGGVRGGFLKNALLVESAPIYRRSRGRFFFKVPLPGGVRRGFLNKKQIPIKRKIIPYNPELKDLARELRRNMTLSEVLLWNELKQKNMLGYDFDRQRPIGNFIVDFYCKELSLAIEIDGDTHNYKYDYDDERQTSLEKLGIHFLRFEDIEVKKNMTNVLRVIEDWIEKNKPTPNPSREGNSIEKDLIKYNKPTPDPFKEGTLT